MSTDFAKTWPTADPDAIGGADRPPPEGFHIAELNDAGAWTSKAGNDTMKLTWRTGDFEWSSLYGFREQKNANAAKAAARDVGVNLEACDSLALLDAALKERRGTHFDVDVVTKPRDDGGVWVNTYVKGEVVSDLPAINVGSGPTLEAAVASGAVPTTPVPATDDIPF